ncbi:Serine/threonine-protein kinase PrkC [Enhygromyxa salina]|uniref:Serine/threonine-protein kinase PrkC n=1 Tax=Enhygromyxa salina TaxID=215803 RepID=A0A2S9XC79_9BACT|nr:serine/threonine-protein kinase [Enhygromyxa salina]PRP90462.1 Serine/threonine-protein kinase PrkC [Enhygromyxa salina]
MPEWSEVYDADAPGLDLLTSPHGTPTDLCGAVTIATGMKNLVNPALPAPRCGRFEIRTVLGSGSFGSVFLAWDPELEREVALKVCPSDPLLDSANLLGEARSIAQLCHPNIITIHDVMTGRDKLALAMEYVGGRTLYHYAVEHKPDSLAALIQIFIGVARGLAAAHDKGVVHRDLKPQNILLHEDLRPCVADFGVARIIGKPKLTDLAIGTKAYVAPEVLAGRGQLGDARSDQWSFFVMLCECIDGWLPMFPFWVRELPDAKMLWMTRRWLRRKKLVRTEVPEALAEILRVGLALDPDERFPDMHAVADELEKVFVRGLVAGPSLAVAPSSEGVVVRPVSNEAAPPVLPWRKKWGLLALLLVMVVGLGGQAYLLARREVGRATEAQVEQLPPDSADQSRRGEDSPCVADGVPIRPDASVRAMCRALRTDGLQAAYDIWKEITDSRTRSASSASDWFKVANDTAIFAQTIMNESGTADAEQAVLFVDTATRLADVAQIFLSDATNYETTEAVSQVQSIIDRIKVAGTN